MRNSNWIVAAVTFAASLALSHAAIGADAVKVISSFKGGSDGAVPVGPLTDVAGVLYGTTSGGGGTGCGGSGCGTVFAIGPDGGGAVLYRFSGSPKDGATPVGQLVNVGGVLYGTTEDGGSHKCDKVHCGTVYSITTGGKEKVLYNFAGGKDGSIPQGGMVQVGSLLYGTTFNGGGHTGCLSSVTCGTVFSITVAGAEKVIHAFAGAGSDGGNPSGGLTVISGRLYGTTEFGGLANCTTTGSAAEGCGIVYSMTTGGGENILHEFKGGFDGALPTEGVIDVGGMLYGTAYQGGSDSVCSGGCGILYSMSIGGVETVLHTFGVSAKDGLNPSGLVFLSNNLYGVTYGGGSHGCTAKQGCGTAYSASTGGKVTVLHKFDSVANDAELADSRLVGLSGKLYGVSNRGGNGNCSGPNGSTGCGTIFQLTP